MKKLAEICDYNPNELTSTGADWTLYDDGHVSAVTRSRWQGSRDGDRWISDPGEIAINSIEADNPDNDAEANLVAYVTHFRSVGEYYDDAGFRRVRSGWLVQ